MVLTSCLTERSHNHILARGYYQLILSCVHKLITRPGRLYQSGSSFLRVETRDLTISPVEYAMEAISHAGTVLGVLATDGVVLAAEKKVTGKLLDLSEAKEGGYGGSGEKIFLLNSYVPDLTHCHSTHSCLVKKCHRWRCGHHCRREFSRQLCTICRTAALAQL